MSGAFGANLEMPAGRSKRSSALDTASSTDKVRGQEDDPHGRAPAELSEPRTNVPPLPLRRVTHPGAQLLLRGVAADSKPEHRHGVAHRGCVRPGRAAVLRARHGDYRPGPRHPARDAASPHAPAAVRDAGFDRLADAETTDGSALRERFGAGGSRARDRRGPPHDAEGDQAARQELAGGLAEGVGPGVDGLLLERAHEARGHEPAEIAWTARRDLVEIHACDRTLLELDRMTRSDQPGGELADSRLVPDERDARRLPHVLFEVGHECRVRGA